MSGLHDALLFIVNTVFSLYLFVLVVRVLLAFAGANYFDPVTQFVARCTNFAVKPLRRVIPNYNGIEISTVILIVAIEFIKFAIILALTYSSFSILGLSLIAIADTLKLFLQTLFYAIILQAILSWVQPQSPLNMILYRINAPLMRPIQRLVPTIGGIDISPIPAMMILQLLIILIVNPIMAAGASAMIN